MYRVVYKFSNFSYYLKNEAPIHSIPMLWFRLESSVNTTKSHLTVLHLVPHTTWRWLSHCDANTLLRRPRENSLSLRMPGSLPAANPRRLRCSRNSCCCCGRNSRPRRAHTTELRLPHNWWAWREEEETRLRLGADWHRPNCQDNQLYRMKYSNVLYIKYQ